MPTDQNPYEHESEESNPKNMPPTKRGCHFVVVVFLLAFIMGIIGPIVLFAFGRHAAAARREEAAIKRQQLEQRQIEEQAQKKSDQQIPVTSN